MRALIAALSVFILSGCMSTLQGAYDEAARTECERSSDARDIGSCLDRVDQNRRERD